METPAHALQDAASPIAILDIGHNLRQDQTKRVHKDVAFAAFDLLARVVTMLPPFPS